jgi:hypothetical protein
LWLKEKYREGRCGYLGVTGKGIFNAQLTKPNMKQLLFLLILFSFKISFGQVDSIEYNIFEQIYDFQLENEEYYFKNFSNGIIIEKGQIIFNSKTYFDNFNYKLRKPEYQDSVQLAIISRTLQGYNERRLYDSQEDFIRIC